MTTAPAQGGSPVPLVLLIDPDEDTRRLHAATLAPLTSDIDEADDGATGLAHALARPADLIITELRLPRIDGYELCRLLRSDVATRAARILVVTASAFPADIERARREGADAVLAKPADPNDVRAQAQELLKRSEQLRRRRTGTEVRAAARVALSRVVLSDGAAPHRRLMSRTHARQMTSAPPTPPPELHCPECDRPLAYEYSHVGGVSAKFPEQWDYYRCPVCGAFQYRQRTRRLRRI